MPRMKFFGGDKESTDPTRHVSIVSTAPPPQEEVARNEHAKKVDTTALTGASSLSIRQSLVPLTLVTILFFLWGFAYGLLDTLNAKFQSALGIGYAQSAGLQAAYFGAYFTSPLTFAGWLYVIRKLHSISRMPRTDLLVHKRPSCWIPLDFHHWFDHLWYRVSHVLAVGGQDELWRLLWIHVHCRVGPFDSRNIGKPLYFR